MTKPREKTREELTDEIGSVKEFSQKGLQALM